MKTEDLKRRLDELFGKEPGRGDVVAVVDGNRGTERVTVFLQEAILKGSWDVVLGVFDHVVTLRNDDETYGFGGARRAMSDVIDRALKQLRQDPESRSELLARRTDDEKTLLHIAVESGTLEEFNGVLEGCDVDATNKDKKTALHLAAEFGSASSTAILLGYNAKLRIKDIKGNTPLHSAAASGSLEVLDLLLRCGGRKLQSKGKILG